MPARTDATSPDLRKLRFEGFIRLFYGNLCWGNVVEDEFNWCGSN